MFEKENKVKDVTEEKLEGVEENKEIKQVDEDDSISSERLGKLMKVISPIIFLFQTVGVIIFGWFIGSWIATSVSLFWGRSLFFLFLIAGMVRYVHLMTKEPPGRGP